MSALTISVADLPEEIPVFPLTGALLLPQGRLPLNIFEPRYLAMIEDSMGHGRVFGMIQPDASGARGTSGPALYRVGCLGRITSFSETEDGRFLVTLTGMLRFHVVEEIALRRGYRRVRADYGGFAGDLANGEAGPLDRAALVGALRPYFKAQHIDANWDAIDQTADATLVTTLCMVCPFDPREKQALLEAPTPGDRAGMLVALLQMEAHGGAGPEGRPS
ncbi:LON peptidase substrate-binding domain-containing protein [Humitalea sp. 24SJ18S-53]|uniref:LON peptidase substrate-binding domain-containing protein n=1 Tax=Humitalea sp. 24SJ18S-53 TaxID=3422307 RepID=UPI003D667E7C